MCRKLNGRPTQRLTARLLKKCWICLPSVLLECNAYGYSAENRHLVRSFLHGTKPALTFEDGLEVVKLLMAAYQSAEQGRTINLPVRGLESYKPLVARGKWKP